jgi:hypothetical protein
MLSGWDNLVFACAYIGCMLQLLVAHSCFQILKEYLIQARPLLGGFCDH